MSVLATAAFWRDLLERAGRQAAQTVYPIVVGIATSGGQLDYTAVTVAVAVAIGVTILKAIATVNVTPGESLPWQLVDRAVPAAAGVAAGAIPVDLMGLQNVSWSHVGWASLAAAGLAMLAMVVTPASATSQNAVDAGGA